MAQFENKAFEPDDEKLTTTKVENHVQHNGVPNGHSLRYISEIVNYIEKIKSLKRFILISY